MNPIASYLRHIIVTGILLVAEKYQMPVEGMEDAAHAIGLLVVGSLTWASVKFIPSLATK